jgi:hypothetical protein
VNCFPGVTLHPAFTGNNKNELKGQYRDPKAEVGVRQQNNVAMQKQSGFSPQAHYTAASVV